MVPDAVPSISRRDWGAMGKCDKLLDKARHSPTNVTFLELCRLAECHGFVLARSRGSHFTYKAPGVREVVSLQRGPGGKAKVYQIQAVLKHIDAQREQDG